jgi:S-adenosylmethionine:tRNA ribosyltransferase-isomerase
VVDRRTGELQDRLFVDLVDLLRPGDLLVLNRSRVFPARLLGRRLTGGQAEILLVRPRGEGRWDAMLRPAARLKAGEEIAVGRDLRVRVEDAAGRGATTHRTVSLLSSLPLDEVLERVGHVPLPPYITRPDRPADRQRYQTVYAREAGSVAAPTAGLHFTPELLSRLAARGVEQTEVLLHVGPGTFRPVTAADVRQHRVAPEPFTVPEAAAEAVARTRERGGRVVAVGTTSARTLETVATRDRRISPGSGDTDLVIVPGRDFRVVDALITNFHLPRSSLLLLVSAFATREHILAAYGHAARTGYRFYSYGDATFLV